MPESRLLDSSAAGDVEVTPCLSRLPRARVPPCLLFTNHFISFSFVDSFFGVISLNVGIAKVWPSPLSRVYTLVRSDLSKPCGFKCHLYVYDSLYHTQTSPLPARHCVMFPLSIRSSLRWVNESDCLQSYSHTGMDAVVCMSSKLL